MHDIWEPGDKVCANDDKLLQPNNVKTGPWKSLLAQILIQEVPRCCNYWYKWSWYKCLHRNLIYSKVWKIFNFKSDWSNIYCSLCKKTIYVTNQTTKFRSCLAGADFRRAKEAVLFSPPPPPPAKTHKQWFPTICVLCCYYQSFLPCLLALLLKVRNLHLPCTWYT